MSAVAALVATFEKKAHVPTHRAAYDETVDRIRKNCTVVPARHSTEPNTMRAVFPR